MIPTSMTKCLAGYSPRIVTFLALKNVRLLICGWATAVLGVGGWSTCFSGMHTELSCGPFLFEVMAKVLKVPVEFFRLVPQARGLGQPLTGVGFMPRSRHPSSSCVETVT